MKGMIMTPIQKRRIILFLAIAFGISWLTALVIQLTGGLVNSPIVIEGSSITLAYILLASVYMWGPAIANILTRIITKEGKENLYFNLRFRKDWGYVVAAWLGTPLLVMLGAGLFFVLFPSYFDANLSLLSSQLAEVENGAQTATVMQVVLMQAGYAIVLSPILNMISTFGEEFGWRGYLLPKLQVLGTRKAIILQGIIWGIWHLPVILMGYNYGFDYPGSPWLGPIAMVWFTVLVGIFFAWLTIKTKSMWPANIAHGALNGIAAIGTIFLAKAPPALIGPYPTGVVGSIPFLLLGVGLLLWGFPEEKPEPFITAG